jgi:hypothetical protein
MLGQVGQVAIIAGSGSELWRFLQPQRKLAEVGKVDRDRCTELGGYGQGYTNGKGIVSKIFKKLEYLSSDGWRYFGWQRYDASTNGL